MRVLVAGSTGYLGRYVVSELHARGHIVRALVRDPARLGPVRGCVTEVFVGQATEHASLEGVADGVDCIISCLGNRTFNRKPTVWDVDRDANLNLVERAQAAEISRFIFVSVLAGRQTRSRVPQIEAREQVVDAVSQGPVPWTIIRPAGFFNDMVEFLDMAAKGTAWLVGKGDSRFAPIHGADLATYIVDRLEDDAAEAREFPVSGPELLTQREIAELAFSALNQSSRIKATPDWLVPMLAKLVIPFNVNMGSFLAMLAAMAGEQDTAAVSTGEHFLADFYREQLASADRDLRAGR